MINFILSAIISLAVSASTFWVGFNLVPKEPLPVQSVSKEEVRNIISEYLKVSKSDDKIIGATLPVAGATYNLSGSGVTGSATSITLQSLTLPQTSQKLADSDFSPTFHLTLEPGNRSRQEIVSCTTVTQNSGGTATLSGCLRGLAPITPFTASTTLQFSHAGGSQVIFSDPPQLFNLFTAKDNTETITGQWFHSVFPENTSGSLPTTSQQFATKIYVDGVGAGGFTAANIGDGKSIYARGTSPETIDVNTSTYPWFELKDGKFRVATSTISSGTATGTGLDEATQNFPSFNSNHG